MPFKKIDENDIQFLVSVCGSERVILSPNINQDFSHDEMPEYGKFYPEVLVEAECTDEIAQIMAYANERLIPVTPRGAGTGLCGGCVPLYGGILLSLMRMNHILEIDTDNLIAVTEPGVRLMELAAKTEEYGLLYPPDPGEKSATIGGNVMTNAGGMRAIRYGVTRDYIRGMEAVLPTGEIVKLGGKIAKSSSGYSLKDLIVGSEGTLGIVTKLELKLIKLPCKSVTLLVAFDDLQCCLSVVPKILMAADAPTNLEFMERDIILYAEEYLGRSFPDKSANAYILVTYSGNTKAEIDSICTCVAELCLAEGAQNVFISDTPDRQDSIWQPRGAFLEAIKNSAPAIDECDVVVPINQVGTFLKYAKELEHKENIRIKTFGHAGDGNLHIYLCKDACSDYEWSVASTRIMGDLYEQAIKLGGQVSGEHGIGHAKKRYLKQSVGEVQMELMQGIKRVFDPNGILNPGKVVCN